MNVLDLFSGIGGFSLGLERAGMRTAAFCEIDPYCRAVLRKHWPNVPVFDDVRTLTAATLADTKFLRSYRETDHSCRRQPDSSWGGDGGDRERCAAPCEGWPIDVICGGFPCQDISTAGKGAGIDGERSGLWSEFARIIGDVRPRYAIVENVSALLNRGLERVLGDLAALGYDAEWHCIPASAVGAPHRRDRVWIVAYATSASQSEMFQLRFRISLKLGRGDWGVRDNWLTEPDLGRVAHGVPSRVDRLRALGNAVVPQIPEIIGRAIMKAEERRERPNNP